jgi:hypothetical protein
MQLHAGWQWRQPAISSKRTNAMKAHELLNDATKWTQGAFARNVEGKLCNPEDAAATCFCIAGAVRRCYQDWVEYSIKQERIHDAVEKISGGLSPMGWNDYNGTTFEDVRNLLIELDI